MKCTVVDSAIESLNLRKVCTIISKYPDQVEDFIINDLHRSATEQNAFGVYTKQEQKVLMTVLTRSETNRLRIHLRQIDPHAFITIVNSSEIIGKGFRSNLVFLLTKHLFLQSVGVIPKKFRSLTEIVIIGISNPGSNFLDLN